MIAGGRSTVALPAALTLACAAMAVAFSGNVEPTSSVAEAAPEVCPPADPACSPVDPSIEGMRQTLFDALALKPGMKLADIGCGGGWFVMRAAKALAPEGVIFATDIDPQAIAEMDWRVQHKQLEVQVRPRLVEGTYETGLDDLPEGGIDVITMVDSLCFQEEGQRDEHVAYLRRFLRVLRPGGRFLHHMDCTCEVTPEAVIARFKDAGFSPRVELLDLPAAVASPACRTAERRRRERFIPVFRKEG